MRFVIFLLATSLPAGLLAQDNSATAFGAREAIGHVSMSPDGHKIAYIVPTNWQGSRLYTVDITNKAAPRIALTASGDPSGYPTASGYLMRD
jgi:Tol biopolymer transport system component